MRKFLYANVVMSSGTHMFPEAREHVTKELTASASSAMKIKVVAPTDNINLTVCARRFRCAEGLLPPKFRR